MKYTRLVKWYDWKKIMNRLNQKGQLRVRMGSPGSASVTRVRLLSQWKNIDIRTHGDTLYLSLK